LIGKTNGDTLRDFYGNQLTITVEMSSEHKQESPYYLPPEGLTIISMDEPQKPLLVAKSTKHFNFSHNIYVEEDRPFL
jgi:hypothetical protein